jgi:hypothetical protein
VFAPVADVPILSVNSVVLIVSDESGNVTGYVLVGY